MSKLAGLPKRILGVAVEWNDTPGRGPWAWGWSPERSVTVMMNNRFHQGKFLYEGGWYRAEVQFHIGTARGRRQEATVIGWGRSIGGAIKSLQRNVRRLRRCLP